MNRTLTAAMAFWLIAGPAYACQSSPGHDGTYWRYRVVEGRHCWYSAGSADTRQSITLQIVRRHHRHVLEADAPPISKPAPSAPLPGPLEPVPYPPPDSRFGVWPDLPDTFERRWSAITDETY